MLVAETKVRVRYSETEHIQVKEKEVLNFAHFTNYATYYDYGIKAALLKARLTFEYLEIENLLLPITSLHIDFLRPVFYDEHILIRTIVKNMPLCYMEFEFEIFNQKDLLVNKGKAKHAFLDASTFKPVRIPKWLHDHLAPYF